MYKGAKLLDELYVMEIYVSLIKVLFLMLLSEYYYFPIIFFK